MVKGKRGRVRRRGEEEKEQREESARVTYSEPPRAGALLEGEGRARARREILIYIYKVYIHTK